jgi:hypothetical protein
MQGVAMYFNLLSSVKIAAILIALLPGCATTYRVSSNIKIASDKSNDTPLKIFKEGENIPYQYSVIGTIYVGRLPSRFNLDIGAYGEKYLFPQMAKAASKVSSDAIVDVHVGTMVPGGEKRTMPRGKYEDYASGLLVKKTNNSEQQAPLDFLIDVHPVLNLSSGAEQNFYTNAIEFINIFTRNYIDKKGYHTFYLANSYPRLKQYILEDHLTINNIASIGNSYSKYILYLWLEDIEIVEEQDDEDLNRFQGSQKSIILKAILIDKTTGTILWKSKNHTTENIKYLHWGVFDVALFGLSEAQAIALVQYSVKELFKNFPDNYIDVKY